MGNMEPERDLFRLTPLPFVWVDGDLGWVSSWLAVSTGWPLCGLGVDDEEAFISCFPSAVSDAADPLLWWPCDKVVAACKGPSMCEEVPIVCDGSWDAAFSGFGLPCCDSGQGILLEKRNGRKGAKGAMDIRRAALSLFQFQLRWLANQCKRIQHSD